MPDTISSYYFILQQDVTEADFHTSHASLRHLHGYVLHQAMPRTMSQRAFTVSISHAAAVYIHLSADNVARAYQYFYTHIS